MHGAGLVHRDVKPANILLALDGPRLIDFGIARALDDTALTSTDVVVGSPGFLSPEQARADADVIGPPSDVFSLGCVLAYAATGRPPFGSGAPEAMLYRTVHDAPDLDGVPQELRPLLERCLAKDPKARPGPADIVTEWAQDTPQGEVAAWLPEQVTQLVAERAAAMLALPDVERTTVDPAAPVDGGAVSVDGGAVPVDGGEVSGGSERAAAERAAQAAEITRGVDGPPPAGPSRRRFLTVVSGGVVLAAGGGLGAWTLLRSPGATTGADSGAPPTYTIGVQAALTGEHRRAGRAQQRGVELAVAEFNAREGQPFRLKVRALDDADGPERAVRVAEEFAADRSVLAVIGPTTDAAVSAVVGVYDEALLPLLSVSAQVNFSSVTPHATYLHTRPTTGGQGWAIGLYGEAASDIGRTGVITDRTVDLYSQQITQIALTALRKKQEVVPRVVPAGTEDFAPVVAHMLAEKVDSVVFTGSWAAAASVAKELRRRRFTGPRIATELALDPRFLERAGDAAEGWLITSATIDATAKGEAATFAAAHRRRFGAPPAPYAAEAYDVVGLVADSLRDIAGGGGSPAASSSGRPSPRASSGDTAIDRERLLERLRRADRPGITKRLEIDGKTGRFHITRENSGMFLHRVEGGGFRFLGDVVGVIGQL
ncbi:serine/threonine protein kinase [Streptomyces sp. WZ.A104]|uniref:bifunctional serine/threonine-protein kinase/ABC transporter substrate-binding protein n=1 Tax=Streptomyces sp. WZ.A104 TaxID=2023771 RepID=UPI000BBBD40A|nr:bifunctional serine/threonine-protein kinase/ABC transporter substrate-binding protein [Streptomyces sp. WZ.A104]PCG81165.1 serine/threonine protein kinase [Streptomyces sp. WZ.A104]